MAKANIDLIKKIMAALLWSYEIINVLNKLQVKLEYWFVMSCDQCMI